MTQQNFHQRERLVRATPTPRTGLRLTKVDRAQKETTSAGHSSPGATDRVSATTHSARSCAWGCSGRLAAPRALAGVLVMLWCVACQPPAHDRIATTSDQCETCHEAQYAAAKNPVHEGALPTTCAVCHTTDVWSPALFRHPWPLQGAHAKAACGACHTGKPPVYKGTGKECVDCHKAQYVTANNPVHADALPTTCATCHATDAWSPSLFRHAWPLTGAHVKVACGACHTGKPPVYKGTGQLCVDCHRKDYDGSPYPGHSSFPTSCTDCHSTTAWKPASAAHPEARFPIASGAHQGIACASCHKLAGLASRDNTDCVQCHSRAKYDPKHGDVGGYPSGAAPANFCLQCHSDGRVHDN
jgi:hypothetical protein